MRIPGSPSWAGGNIVIRNNNVVITSGAAESSDVAGRINSGDSLRIWLGNVSLSSDLFDISIDDVNRNTYVKSNVQVTNDMTLTFTQADRR